jgi:transposase
LHCAVNERWSYFHPDEKRGTHAMEAMGILPDFKGVMVHDHWKPYSTYKHCKHSVCNAHHVRELKWVIENHPEYTWDDLLKALLYAIHDAVHKTEEGYLSPETALVYRKRYRAIIAIGKNEMPEYAEAEGVKKQGRRKKSKARNVWERLRAYEEDTLRFMEISYVPFSNNTGEQALRMTKVQQKISGCFRSMEGAKIFCRIRGYLLSAQKHKINPSEALTALFQGRLPEAFFTEDIP